MGLQVGALKLLIIIPNFIFFCAGLSLVVFSSYSLFHFHNGSIPKEHKEDIEQQLNITCGASIASGGILCVISLLACCGAAAGKSKILKAYAIIMCLVILLEIIGTIYAFLASSNIEEVNKDGPNFNYDWANPYTLGLISAIVICIEIILALAACFLSTKIEAKKIKEMCQESITMKHY